MASCSVTTERWNHGEVDTNCVSIVQIEKLSDAVDVLQEASIGKSTVGGERWRIMRECDPAIIIDPLQYRPSYTPGLQWQLTMTALSSHLALLACHPSS